MKIEAVTIYRLDGKEFSSLRVAKTYVEDQIGAIVDSLPRTLSPKDRLAVFELILTNRESLSELLNVTVERNDEDGTDHNLLAL